MSVDASDREYSVESVNLLVVREAARRRASLGFGVIEQYGQEG